MALTRRAAGTAAALVLAVATPLGLWWPGAQAASGDLGAVAPPVCPAPQPIASEWGRSEGLKAPRCVRVDTARNRVWVFGTDGRLHLFDTEGNAVRSFALPGERSGNPQGLDVDADGNILVADTHAHCLLRLRPDGTLIARYGKAGTGPGEFHWPTAICEAPDRTLWVTEYGEQDRLHHLNADGTPIGVYGGTGSEPGQFYRPSNVAIDGDGGVWVADACNHRLQLFDASGAFQREVRGPADALLRYPYDVVVDRDGTLIIAEFGSHRVRRLDAHGRLLQSWGGPGTESGRLVDPWGCTPFADGVLVADTGNHRLQYLRGPRERKVAKRAPDREAGR
ncbi:MAG: SMP-30/gluconolactonase/LRE family protein [Planctomycetota bacterium]